MQNGENDYMPMCAIKPNCLVETEIVIPPSHSYHFSLILQILKYVCIFLHCVRRWNLRTPDETNNKIVFCTVQSIRRRESSNVESWLRRWVFFRPFTHTHVPNELDFKSPAKKPFSNNKNRIKFAQSIVLFVACIHNSTSEAWERKTSKTKKWTLLSTRSKWQRHRAHILKKPKMPGPWQSTMKNKGPI